jgi:hypothetical protein
MSDTEQVSKPPLVIVGMVEGFPHPTEDMDVWCINNSYRPQGGATRVYHLDPVRERDQDFINDVNQMGCECFLQEPHPDIPKSEKFPLDQVLERFGIEYFTSSSPYLIAHALMEGYGRIILWGMYKQNDSLEYLPHVPCINFWVGMAAGMGVHISMEPGMSIAKAFPWESPRYGYTANISQLLCNATLASAYRACAAYPQKFITNKDLPDPHADGDTWEWMQQMWQHAYLDAGKPRMEHDIEPMRFDLHHL